MDRGIDAPLPDEETIWAQDGCTISKHNKDLFLNGAIYSVLPVHGKQASLYSLSWTSGNRCVCEIAFLLR